MARRAFASQNSTAVADTSPLTFSRAGFGRYAPAWLLKGELQILPSPSRPAACSSKGWPGSWNTRGSRSVARPD